MVAYSFKDRFIAPIRAGLGIEHLNERGKIVIPGARPKLQTIRADRKRHARPGEELQLYYGMRTKHCFLIGRAHCTAVTPIRIKASSMETFVGDRRLIGTALNDFAMNDGFESAADMQVFWRLNHEGDLFSGVLIEWTPLN